MNTALHRWAKSFGMVIYLDEDVSKEREESINRQLLQDNDIETVTFIPKEQSFEEIKNTMGENAMILDIFKETPLPSSFDIKLKRDYLDLTRVKEKAAQLQRLEGIQEVQYGEKWLSSLITIAKTVKGGSIFFGVAVFIAVTFITYSTIKILLHRRKEEIETLKLLGASRGFIIGALGGIASSLVILALYSFITYKMVEFLPAMKFIITSLPLQVYLIIPFTGAMMSLLGSFIAIGKIRY